MFFQRFGIDVARALMPAGSRLPGCGPVPGFATLFCARRPSPETNLGAADTSVRATNCSREENCYRSITGLTVNSFRCASTGSEIGHSSRADVLETRLACLL